MRAHTRTTWCKSCMQHAAPRQHWVGPSQENVVQYLKAKSHYGLKVLLNNVSPGEHKHDPHYHPW